ncbi:hypothetical protein F-liban_431 [Faustovirus]|nr:hypothetical protein F-liban_431 [Faustovirus]
MFQQRFKQITSNVDRKDVTLEAMADLYNTYVLPTPINYVFTAPRQVDNDRVGNRNVVCKDVVFTSAPPVGVKRIPAVKLTTCKAVSTNGAKHNPVIVDSDNLMFTWEWDHENNMMRRKVITGNQN